MKQSSLWWTHTSHTYTVPLPAQHSDCHDPQYYSFRWLTLLLSQEFPLPDVLRIWDSVFADEKRYDFLVKVCCAMIILLREQILDNDFACNVKLLQNFPPMDIKVVLRKATSLD